MIEYLQLLEESSIKERYNILFNLGYTYKDIKLVLSYTHNPDTRKAILDNKDKVSIGPTKYSYKGTLDNIICAVYFLTIPSEMYYVIFLLASNIIPQTTRDKLQEVLGYTPVTLKVTSRVSAWTTTCSLCGVVSTKELCWRCVQELIEYTEFRRENFIVPITYLNFKKFIDKPFNFRYKDWEILRTGSTIYYVLKQELYESIREEYPLPFIEYQKAILS